MIAPLKIGVLDFGDGRDFLQQPLAEICARFRAQLAARLSGAGFAVVTGEEVVWSNARAVREAKRLRAADVDAVVFCYSVWAWPQFSRVAAQFLPRPLALFSNVNPKFPGLVGMLAASGSLDQAGIPFSKTFGDLDDDATFARLCAELRAAGTAQRLRGQTYALFGGRALGIDTTVVDPAGWMRQFGIDVDHVDQFEVVRRAEREQAEGERVRRALAFLKKHVRKIHWTKPDAAFRLTEELLSRQLAMYWAMWDLITEFGYDFCGIKGQRELTEHFATCDVAEAFLNDPYHPDGAAKPTVVCATEADADAALTMQMLHLLAGAPALFADVRHYHEKEGVWDLCNSGQHATYFAARSTDPAVNLARVEFRPEGFYFPAGGAAVYHIAAPGDVTVARLTRHDGRYRMAFGRGRFEDFGPQANERLAAVSQDNWPHAFLRLPGGIADFVSRFHANHIHAVYGDFTAELTALCAALDVDVVRLDR